MTSVVSSPDHGLEQDYTESGVNAFWRQLRIIRWQSQPGQKDCLPKGFTLKVLWTMLTFCLSSTRLRQLPPKELEDPEARAARHWNKIAARKTRRTLASYV